MTERSMANRLTALWAGVYFFIIVRGIGSFFPALRLWGVNQAAYINGLWVLYPALLILSVILYMRRYSPKQAPAGTEENFDYSLMTRLLPIALAAAAITCFALFSVKEFFLGDGHYLIAAMADPDIGFKPRGYGELLLHRWYMEIFYALDDYHAYLAYKQLSIASGIIFVGGVLRYGRKIFSSSQAYIGFVALALTSAGTLLFYGYVENYSIVTAAVTLFFLSSIAVVITGRNSLVPVALFIASVFLHMMAIVFLPALLVYLFLVFAPKRMVDFIGHHRWWVAIFFGAAVLVLYALIKIGGPIYWRFAFLSPFPDAYTIDNYALFTWPHLLDYVNLAIFLIPVAVLLSLVAAICREKTANMPERSQTSSATTILLTGAIVGLTAAFIVEPKLGMARDWDMMSVYLIGAGLTGLYVWCEKFSGRSGFGTTTVGLVVVHLSILIPWVTINNAPSSLYAYTINVMEQDPKHGRAGFFRMKSYSEGNNHPVEAARLDMYNREMFPEMWLNRDGLDLMVDLRCREATAKFDSAIAENPAFFSPYLNRGLIFAKRGDYKAAYDDFEIADGLNPYNAYIHTFRGMSEYSEGDTAAAVAEWRHSMEYDARNPLPFLYLADWCRASGRPDSALVYLKHYPGTDFVYSYYFKMGTMHFAVNDSVTVFDDLLTYADNKADTVGIRMVSVVIDHVLRAQYSPH